jgi:uncharacterized protein (DUF488 family)
MQRMAAATDKEKTIWTIGHSTLEIETFLQILSSFQIRLLADVRRYPGSRRYPQFNQSALEESLKERGISYRHFPALGGRRRPAPGSVNTAWRNPAFRAYADYIQTPEFISAVESLEADANNTTTAYMCSEAPWWRCHRSLISDYLKLKGWKVMHIMKAGKADEHPYTSAATIVNGRLDYTNNSLQFE